MWGFLFKLFFRTYIPLLEEVGYTYTVNFYLLMQNYTQKVTIGDRKGELFNYPELKEHIFKSSISYLEQFRILIGYEGPDLFVKDK